nr:hypothetical protein [Tanacetum cinerariifolium]GEZ08337.1 hypothetical protein [Tanacetum cinerariifolium]
YCCFEGSLGDKINCDLDKTPDLSQRPPQNCPKCGNLVDGHYCQGCTLLRKKFKENMFTHCIENGIFQDSSEPSNDNPNVVNALREPSLSIKTPVKIPHKVLHKSTTIVVTSVKEEEKQIKEEHVAKTRYWKILACYDDDDDDYTIAITHKEPDNSLKTRFIKRLLYDNSSPRPPEEFISENSDTAFESFSSFPIPVEDSDSLMEEIDLSFTPNDLMPSGIEEDDYDSERDILILDELLSNDSLLLPENESFHFDIPSSSRPAKPPDGNTGILNVKMMGDISEQK